MRKDLLIFDNCTHRIRQALTKRLFFITGVQKSGTTWLQKALDAHPKILCSGEGHFANYAADIFKQLAAYYHQQLDIVATEVYQQKPYYSYLTPEELQFFMHSLVGLMLSKRSITKDIKCIGDKTPAHALFINDLHALFPEAKFVHIVRDARDVLVSTIKHAERITPKDQSLDYNDIISSVGERWVIYNKTVFDFGKKHPDLLHYVEYSELVQNFEESFAKILHFLEVDHSADIVEKCKEASDFMVLSGGRKPGEEDVNSFYRKGIIGDWKHSLRNEHLEALNRICGHLLKQCGYA